MTQSTPNPIDTERNKAAVLRFMELMDTHQFDALEEVLSPELKLHLGATTMNRQETEAMIRGVYASFPDLTHEVEEVLAVDGRVVLRATDTGTHEGEFEGIAPTGRQVTMGQIGIYRMVDGRIAEIWEQADHAGFMQQLLPAESELAAEIEARFAYWAECEVKKDLVAWAELVADDVVLQPPDAPPVIGKPAALRFQKEFSAVPIVEMKPFDTQIVVNPAGDLAANFGGLLFAVDDGRGRQETQLKSMVVWKRIDGAWRVIANSWSANQPVR